MFVEGPCSASQKEQLCIITGWFLYYKLENKEDKFKCSLVEVHAKLIVTSCIEDNINMAITAKGVSGFLVITSLMYAMPKLLLHILNVHDESFHLV